MNIDLTWTEIKALIVDKTLIRYLDKETFYLLNYSDSGGHFECSILKNSGSEQTDFETNYKALGNKPRAADPLDADNARLARGKVAPLGWTFQMHSVELCTSTVGSIYSKDHLGNDFNFSTLKFYEAVGGAEAQITGDNLNQTYLDTNCIKTVMNLEPTHDYEIIGGHLLHYDSITSDVRVWVVGVPDVPSVYGGSKLMVAGVNLRYIEAKRPLTSDGRASKRLSYNATYHTNKLQFIWRHAAGLKLNIDAIMEFYKP